MITWFTENAATILLTALLALALCAIVRSVCKNHYCGNGCENCPMSGNCRKKES